MREREREIRKLKKRESEGRKKKRVRSMRRERRGTSHGGERTGKVGGVVWPFMYRIP